MARRTLLQSGLVFATLFAIPLFGQAELAQSEKDAVIQKLLDRVDALEREVAALQQLRPPAPTALPGVTQPAVVSSTTAPPAAADNPGRFAFHGYADAGFSRNVDGSATKNFQLGEIDLFGTARLSPRLTALLEVVFETNQQARVAQVPVNVERMLLQYRAGDFFNADIGSYRTALGYYSTAYLRGAWLQTAISRPKMFTFEDSGGVLPLHAVGVSSNGRIPSGDLNIYYIAEVGSSRNYGDTAGLPLEPSFNRAINLAVYSQPRGVPGLEVGFSSYHDLFSPLAGVELARSVWMVHAVYTNGRVEFLNEGLMIRQRDGPRGSGTGLGFYNQIAYRVASSWRPYARVEYLNAYGNGTISKAVSRSYVPWQTVFTGGIRYELTDSAALKFEMGREADYRRPPYVSAAAQLAFTF